MNLSKGGAQGVHSALQFAADVVKTLTAIDDLTESGGGACGRCCAEHERTTDSG